MKRTQLHRSGAAAPSDSPHASNSSARRQSYFITTLGCPKNAADSREMERSLLVEGFLSAENADAADVHIVNTCSFIESAREQTVETVFDAIGVRETHDSQKLVVVGCFTERYHSAVKEEWPEVDFSFGTGLYHRAGPLIREAFGWPRWQGPEEVSPFVHLKHREKHPWVPVKVSDGCDRSCAFCAIPQFRGRFKSRPADEILTEVSELSSVLGVREICLVSQDTNSYGGRPEVLVDLVEELHAVEGVHWLRLLYLYPDRKTEKILTGLAGRALPKLVPYLECPLQHVAPGVLRAMKRPGDAAAFKDLFAMARSLFPGLEIRTSFLLGFPGETSEDVDLLHRFIEETRLEKLALFAYSPEEGTTGFGMSGAPGVRETSRRINELRETHLNVLKEIHMERVGRVYRCMVDEVRPKEILLRRPQDAPEIDENVIVPFQYRRGMVLPSAGDLVDVEITGFFEYDMEGRLVGGVQNA